MASGKGNKSLHKPDGRGGTYSMLPHVAMDALLKSVSPRAVAVALAIHRRFNGFNNGRIGLSMRDLGDAIKSHCRTSNGDAVAELIDAGFLRETRYPKGQRKASEYLLTFISSGKNGEVAATHDYLERLETKKTRGWKFQPRNPSRGESFRPRRKRRGESFQPGATETVGFGVVSPGESFQPHIGNQSGGLSDAGSDTLPDRPKSSRAISSLSAAMDLNELRLFARAYLTWALAGAQSKLAHDAGIPGGTLSKFLSGRSLPDQYRMPLQLAVARSFPMEARHAA